METRQLYPYNDVPTTVILLYRSSGHERFWCQFPGCSHRRGFKSYTGAHRHGRSHVRGSAFQVAVQTGVHPFSVAEYEAYRRQYKARHIAERRRRENLSRAAQVGRRVDGWMFEGSRMSLAAMAPEATTCVVLGLTGCLPLSSMQVYGSDARVFPTALAVMQSVPEVGCHFVVQGRMGPQQAGKDLEVTGWASDEGIVEAIRCAYAWARLHQRAILQQFPRMPQLTDLSQIGSTCYIDLSKAGLQKTGESVSEVDE